MEYIYREIKKEDWIKEGESLFGKDKSVWKFVCPVCGHVQTANDFKEIGVDPTGKFYFSCIGRWDTRIPDKDVGTVLCNVSLGNLVWEI